MTVPVWPASLPQKPLREGFQRALGIGRIMTPMAKGPPKTRRGLKLAQPVSMNIELTTAQLRDFETFYWTTTLWGSLSWDYPDPTNVGQTWRVLFGDMGEEGPNIINTGGDNWRATFPLLIMP